MRSINFRDAYEFDPESYAEGGGLPELLRRVSQHQSAQQPGLDFGSAPGSSPEYNAGSFSSPQEGLLCRLRALQVEQGQYQPVRDTSEQTTLPQDPNFRQLSRIPNGAPLATPDSSGAPPAPIQSVQQLEADQAQQAREAAAARMARGVRSVARAEGPPPDPIDVTKAVGIGLVNGTINTAGLPGAIATGFGYLPNNLLLNGLGRATGLGQFSPDEPDWIRQRATADGIRKGIETLTGEFYQPKSRTGRYAETIAEFVPAILGGAGLAARAGGPAAAAALRELPETILKHAIAPGIVVQGLEDAYPESPAGSLLQKGYPAARRALPLALGAKRYFGF
jgi:hypothetical protein